jgi:hypothetical protein
MDGQVSASNVSIQSISASAARVRGRVEVTTTIVIHNFNDDDAQNVRCVVVLPPTSRVTSTNPPASVGPSFGSLGPSSQFVQSEATNGFVLFDLPSSMGVGATETLVVVTRAHEDWAGRPVSAFVWSDVPDPDPSTNFAFTSAVVPASLRPIRQPVIS